MSDVDYTIPITDLAAHFAVLRHSENHHLGLGDIRLTLGQQEEIAHSHNELNVNIASLESELAQAKERIADYEDDRRAILSEQCASDEKHCACVPDLRRRIAEFEERLQKAQVVIDFLYDGFSLHDENCPEDDTCDCGLAQLCNDVMHDYDGNEFTPPTEGEGTQIEKE